MKKFLTILVIIASTLALSSCGRHIAQQKPQQLSQQPTTYLCPMHTDQISSVPGKCPKCGMKLVSFDDYRNSKSGTTNQNRMPDSHMGVAGSSGGSGGGHSGHH